jgi:hypothetical protein
MVVAFLLSPYSTLKKPLWQQRRSVATSEESSVCMGIVGRVLAYLHGFSVVVLACSQAPGGSSYIAALVK